MKNLIDTSALTKQEILEIFAETDKMKNYLLQGKKDLKILEGKSIVLLFYENSTRTLLSFEKAAKYLGASVSTLAVGSSSVKKGESIADTMLTVDNYGADLVVMRHAMSGAPKIAEKYLSGKIINGGDGLNAHPTQALYDMYTIYKQFGDKKIKAAIIGDIKHSRVARSNINVMNKFGITPTVFGPKTLIPDGVDKLGCTVAKSLDEALIGADVVMTLRIQLERQQNGLFPGGEYAKFYGVNSENIKLAAPHAIVMHPGPVNRGAELTDDIVDSEKCVKDLQVLNGLALRMALIKLMLTED